MTDSGFVVIDAGSGSVKSFLVSPFGELLARSERKWDRRNWRSEDAWRLITESTFDLLRGSNVVILGVSCTSMREEFVLVDEAGEEVRFNTSEESMGYGYKILERYGEAMYRSSGHWPVPNWIAGAILPWIKEAQPMLFKQVSSILMISDWINFKLSGEIATEGTASCETSLFSVLKHDWDWDIIDELGLLKSIFPRVLRNGEILGSVSKEAAEETEIPEGVPVVMGGADTQCGLLGMGVLKGEAGAVGGTTTPIQVVTGKPLFDPEMRTWTNCHLDGVNWILESNVGYTGRSIRWLREELGVQSYTDIASAAMDVPIGSNGLLTYLGPHVFNGGPPYWPMDRLSDLPIPPTIIGSHSFTVPELARAIIESNSYGVKANLNQLTMISGSEFDHLHFCGGNSKSDLWMQIQADVLDIPIQVPHIHDASAIGAAILASIGCGYHNTLDDAVSTMVRVGRVYEPRPGYAEEYRGYYQKWIAVREQLARIKR